METLRQKIRDRLFHLDRLPDHVIKTLVDGIIDDIDECLEYEEVEVDG